MPSDPEYTTYNHAGATTRSAPNCSLVRVKPSTNFFLFMTPVLLFIVIYSQQRSTHCPHITVDSEQGTAAARLNPWLDRFHKKPTVIRLGCREYEAGGQTCVFAGTTCIAVGKYGPDTERNQMNSTPAVYFLDSHQPDNSKVPTDDWCSYRHQSADPRYYGPRHWPVMNSTVVPQWSCLNAWYRNPSSLFAEAAGNTLDQQKPAPGPFKAERISWHPSVWMVNLDYASDTHNYHLLLDVVWILDVSLWQRSLGLYQQPADRSDPDRSPLFDSNQRKIFLPQSRKQFEAQTSKDVNRLVYALVLELNLSRLYPAHQDMHQTSIDKSIRRVSLPLLEAYPELLNENRFIFGGDLNESGGTDLVCTRRLTVGAKLGNVGHERVCRSMRERSWRAFGIPPVPMVRIGQVYFPRPPRRIIVLQRHLTRSIRNLPEVFQALHERFVKPHGVELEIVSTADVQTAEEHVRVFSRAGVVLTAHGSQSMGQIWMPRYSALVEVMPFGYADYAFSLMSESCKVYHYELQSMKPPELSDEDFRRICHNRDAHLLNPCSMVKHAGVFIDVKALILVVRHALEKLGHESLGPRS